MSAPRILRAEVVRHRGTFTWWSLLLPIGFTLWCLWLATAAQSSGLASSEGRWDGDVLGWLSFYAIGFLLPISALVGGACQWREQHQRHGGALWRDVSPTRVLLARLAVLSSAMLASQAVVIGLVVGHALVMGAGWGPVDRWLPLVAVMWAVGSSGAAGGVLAARVAGGTGTGAAVVGAFAWSFAGAVGAEADDWALRPWTWAVRPMLPLLGTHSNSVVLEEGAPAWEYPVAPGVLLQAGLCAVLVVCVLAADGVMRGVEARGSLFLPGWARAQWMRGLRARRLRARGVAGGGSGESEVRAGRPVGCGAGAGPGPAVERLAGRGTDAGGEARASVGARGLGSPGASVGLAGAAATGPRRFPSVVAATEPSRIPSVVAGVGPRGRVRSLRAVAAVLPWPAWTMLALVLFAVLAVARVYPRATGVGALALLGMPTAGFVVGVTSWTAFEGAWRGLVLRVRPWRVLVAWACCAGAFLMAVSSAGLAVLGARSAVGALVLTAVSVMCAAAGWACAEAVGAPWASALGFFAVLSAAVVCGNEALSASWLWLGAPAGWGWIAWSDPTRLGPVVVMSAGLGVLALVGAALGSARAARRMR
ncbi:hypothetical protein M3T53_01545 [Actinomyces sp. B33]|uniref:hypothetical protein n=1 Tax=Actinomyces sp. B33 TaxID=2942131 RepID=UPI00234085A3|nr:hypothetical protein [Actinomyces sp. B33]MDC4232399.1 hypothetical protein [Actinomyces sp. B33]